MLPRQSWNCALTLGGIVNDTDLVVLAQTLKPFCAFPGGGLTSLRDGEREFFTGRRTEKTPPPEFCKRAETLCLSFLWFAQKAEPESAFGDGYAWVVDRETGINKGFSLDSDNAPLDAGVHDACVRAWLSVDDAPDLILVTNAHQIMSLRSHLPKSVNAYLKRRRQEDASFSF